MLKRNDAFIVVAMGLLMSAAPVTSAETGSLVSRDLNLVNIMPEYFSFVAEAKDIHSDRGRANLFRKKIITPNRDLYGTVSSPFDRSDKGIIQFVSKLEPKQAKLHELTDRLPGLVQSVADSFYEQFPDMGNDCRVYLMPSFDHFDGSSCTVKGTELLLLGVDVLADNDKNLRLLITHELFHIYHRGAAPSLNSKEGNRSPLYIGMWEEGLATYVAKELNPGATLASALLNSEGDELPKLDKKSFNDSCGIALSKLESTDDGDYIEFLVVHHRKKGELPNRIGYLIGLKIAEQLGKTYTLKELAAIDKTQLLPLMKKTLSELQAL
jgi:hypothetical protein